MPLDMIKDRHLGGYVRGGDPGTFCAHLWRWAVREFSIRSVLDVGCGEGHATRQFRELGCDAMGVDGCRQAIRESVVPEHVALHDFCDGPFLPGRRFDMIWSCEFLEHVDERYLPHILETFSLATRVIAVTHAFPREDRGHHHVNCRPSSYWIRHIQELGFECHVGLSKDARRATLADYGGVNHFARSGLVFLRDSANAFDPAGSRGSRWQAAIKAARINLGFRLSPAFRAHKRRRRTTKRRTQRPIPAPHV